jgi:hypothetical protein
LIKHTGRIRITGFENIVSLFRITGSPVSISDLTISAGSRAPVPLEDLGGGIYNTGKLELRRVTLSDNFAALGGAIYNAGPLADLTVINSTISGNFAIDPGIGCDGGGWGGGIANDGGLVTVISSTISENHGPCGSGIWQDSGTVVLNNTIIVEPLFFDPCCQIDGGEIISRGYNLDSDRTCGLDQPNDLPGVDPLLGPLQDNGGATETQEPSPGSPAIDAGDASTAPPRDQRGVRRPQGPAADMGSVEVENAGQ